MNKKVILSYKNELYIIFFVIALALTLFISFKITDSKKSPISSVEVGVATLSPHNKEGGYAIPASCPSFAHSVGQCGPSVELKVNGQDAISLTAPASYTLSWTNNLNTYGCTASGSPGTWTGSKVTNSTQVINFSTPGTHTYTLTCRGANFAETFNYLNTVDSTVPGPYYDTITNPTAGDSLFPTAAATYLSRVYAGSGSIITADITIGSDNIPRIAYYNYTFGTFELYKCLNANCTGTGTWKLFGRPGSFSFTAPPITRIKLLPGDIPQIVYKNAGTSGTYRIITCSDANCSSYTTLDEATAPVWFSSTTPPLSGTGISTINAKGINTSGQVPYIDIYNEASYSETYSNRYTYRTNGEMVAIYRQLGTSYGEGLILGGVYIFPLSGEQYLTYTFVLKCQPGALIPCADQIITTAPMSWVPEEVTDSVTVTINGAVPAITASCAPIPVSASVGQNVVWTANASGGTGTYTYNWSGTEGLTGNTKTVNKSYSTPGTKTGSVTITSGTGAQLQTKTVSCTSATIKVPTPINLQFSCPSPGTTGTLSWTNVSGATTYDINLDDPSDGLCVNGGNDRCPRGVTGPPRIFNSLIAGTTYRAQVRACMGASCGVFTAFTPNVTCTPPSAIDANLYVQVGTGPRGKTANVNYNGSVILSWDSANESACSVTRTIPTPATVFSNLTDAPYPPGRGTVPLTATSYKYELSCTNTNGATPANDFVTVNVRPSPPVIQTNSCPVPGTTGSISWIPGAGPAPVNYNVGVNDLSNGWLGCGVGVTPNAGDYCFNKISTKSVTFSTTPGHSYDWSVQACNTAGCSATVSPQVGSDFTCSIPAITANLKVRATANGVPNTSSISINYNKRAYLSWTSTNATACSITKKLPTPQGAPQSVALTMPDITPPEFKTQSLTLPSYKYELSCTNTNGATPATDAITINVNPSTASAICSPSNTNVKVGDEVIWTATASGGGPTYWYAWGSSGGNCTNSHFTSPITCTYTEPGTYSMTMDMFSSNGNDIGNNCGTVTITPADTTEELSVSCVARQARYDRDTDKYTVQWQAIPDGGAGDNLYRWTLPSGDTDGRKTFIRQYSPNQTINGTVKVTDKDNNTDTGSCSIKIPSAPPPPPPPPPPSECNNNNKCEPLRGETPLNCKDCKRDIKEI